MPSLRDDMNAEATTSTLEDAWAEMADGLHIQRYFLDTRSAKKQRIERLFAERGVGTARLTEIRAAVPDGLLEHFLDPRQPMPLESAVDGLRFAEMASTLGGSAMLIVQDSACVVGATPLIDRRRLPDAAIARSPRFVDAIAAVLDVTAVTYFSQLNTRVVVEADRLDANAADVFSAGDLLTETVLVPLAATPYAFAEDLAARSAARFWFSFLLSRPDPALPAARAWRSPWSAEDRDTVSLATEIMAKSVRLRMRERVLRNAPDLLDHGERSTYRSSLPELRARLIALAPFVDRIEHILAEPAPEPVPWDNNMDVGDLIGTLFPGPNQFHKYWQGGCAGQL